MPVRTVDPVVRLFNNPTVIKTITPDPAKVRTTQIGGPVQIQGIKSVIGQTDQVINIALGSASVPDSYQIIRILQALGEQFGRVPATREAAVTILGSMANDAAGYQVQKLTEWVKQVVTYVKDPDGSEYVISPLRMLEQVASTGRTAGDCDDHVLLLNSLLKSVGLDARPVGVKLYSKTRFDHVISTVFYESQWHDIDPCAKFSPQPNYMERLVV